MLIVDDVTPQSFFHFICTIFPTNLSAKALKPQSCAYHHLLYTQRNLINSQILYLLHSNPLKANNAQLKPPHTLFPLLPITAFNLHKLLGIPSPPYPPTHRHFSYKHTLTHGHFHVCYCAGYETFFHPSPML